MEIKTSHKLVRRIKDDLFDEEQLDLYNLYILAGSRDLQLAVADSRSGKFVVLEDHVFPDPSAEETYSVILRHLFDSHHLLQAGFWNDVTIGIKNPAFAQVPSILFDASTARELLELNTSLEPDASILWNKSVSSEVTTVFSIPENLNSWLGNYYRKKEVRFVHHATALLAGASSVHRGNAHIYAFVDRFRFHLIAMEGSNLNYYNQFQIKQFSDYTRYLMLVMNQLGLNQLTTPVTLHGFVGKDSPHFQELKRYIRTLELGGRPLGSSWSPAFDEIQDHQFFDIFALQLTR